MCTFGTTIKINISCQYALYCSNSSEDCALNPATPEHSYTTEELNVELISSLGLPSH